MNRKYTFVIMLIMMTAPLSGCLGPPQDDLTDSSGEPQPQAVRVLTYDVFALSSEMLDDFTNRTGYEVELIKVDDAGTVLARALQTKDDPIADVIVGIDNSFLQVALDNGIYQPITNAQHPSLHTEATLPYSGEYVTPYDWGRVCFNYDTSYADGENVSEPTSLWDFTQPEWNGKVAVQNPRTSSPGRSFLLATVDYFDHDESDGDFSFWWQQMKANEVIVTDGWSEAYETHYSAGYGQWYDGFVGDAQAVVSYCHSPGVEAYYGDNWTTSKALTLNRSSFLQVEYVGIAAGADNIDGASAFIEAMLGEEVQSSIALTNFMYPVDRNYSLPTENGYLHHSGVPELDSQLSPTEIAAGIEEWLDEWDRAMA